MIELLLAPPQWIWTSDDADDQEHAWFARAFEIEDPTDATLAITCDNVYDVWLNGAHVGRGDDWQRLDEYRVDLTEGRNLLVVHARNQTGPAALAARLTYDGGSVATDEAWLWTRGDGDPGLVTDIEGWMGAHAFGPTSDTTTWADPFDVRVATPVESITVPEGFTVERLHSAQAGEGSWVALATDGDDLLIAPQDSRLWRWRDGDMIPFELDFAAAQGMLQVDDELWLNIPYAPAQGGGLYRLRDTDGDGLYDESERVSAHGNRSEHGNHGIVQGPDDALYMVHGNYVALPEGTIHDPHGNWAEDVLLPRLWDPRGHAVNIMAPGGQVLRYDGTDMRLFAAGLRNTYDITFHDGSLFGYDADMEWDIGAPWYRAPRLVHLVPGAEFGWRSGSAKWSPEYPDSLPPVIDTDVGSPTGMVSARGSAFPDDYQDAILMADWSYGRIFAVHLSPDGATFAGRNETFLTGRPFNVTDIIFDKAGDLYAVTGGRGTQSGLYRVTWNGEPGTASAPDPTPEFELRRRLETTRDLDLALEHIGHEDRFIRYASRLVVERHDPSSWRSAALEATEPLKAIHLLLALARTRPMTDAQSTEHGAPIFARLTEIDPTGHEIDWLRTAMVTCMRQGDPTDHRDALVAHAMPMLDHDDEEVRREAARFLTHLDAPGLVPLFVERLADAPTPERAMHYALLLRLLDDGWTPETRRTLFTWLAEAGTLPGGMSLRGFVDAIRTDALARVPDDERETYASITAPEREATTTERAFVRGWMADDLSSEIARIGFGRSFERGKALYTEATCLQCHRIRGEGGDTGPDLTGAGGRFARSDLIDAILNPNKDVSDQYQQEVIALKDGNVLFGRVIRFDDVVIVETDPLTGTRSEVTKADVASRTPLGTSPMPGGLLNNLTLEEILDLLAYVESGGDPDYHAFTPE